jgi:hypothetical protein
LFVSNLSDSGAWLDGFATDLADIVARTGEKERETLQDNL